MARTSTRRPLPAIAALLCLAVFSAVVWWRVLDRPSHTVAAPATKVTPAPVVTCAPGVKTIALPKPTAVKVAVFNGDGTRNGLASTVTGQLKARGFITVGSFNSTPINTVAQIHYGTAGKAGAHLVSFYFTGSTLVADKRKDSLVKIVLGKSFQTLAAPATVAATVARNPNVC